MEVVVGKMYGVSNVFIGATCAVAFAFTTGCGDPSADGSEPISTTQAAFSQSACANVAANQTFTGGINPSIVTPRAYNTCYKGYVVDIDDLDPVYAGSGNALDGRIELSYADNAITDQATCEATELRMIVYRCLGGGATSTTGPHECYALDDQRSYGSWISIFGTGQCVLNRSFSELSPGTSYRVAATARSPSSATRKMSIATYPPEDVK